MTSWEQDNRLLLTSHSMGSRAYPVVPVAPFPHPERNPENDSVKALWKFHSKMSMSRILVANSNFTNCRDYGISGYVYATTKNGFVFALNRDTGKVIWQQEVLRKEEDDTASGVDIVYFDAPVAISELVNSEENAAVVETRRKIPIRNEKIRQRLITLTHSSFAVVYGGMYVFDGLNGALLWKNSLESSVSKLPKVGRINDSLSVLIGSRRNANITCLEATSGEMKWSVQLDGGSTSDFAVHSSSNQDADVNTGRRHVDMSVIYVGTSTAPNRAKAKDSLSRGCIYAIDATDGKIVWRFNPSIFASFLAEPSLHFKSGVLDTIIAATSGDQPNHVFAVHHDTGLPKWRFTLEHTVTNVIAKPIISGLHDLVLICGNDGSVVALDANSGVLKWVRIAAKAIIGTPSLVQYKDKLRGKKHKTYELMYVASLDGYIHAVDMRWGDLLWTYKSSSGAITSSLSTLRQYEPKVEESQEGEGTDDVIYFSDNFGFLSALRTIVNEYVGDDQNTQLDRPIMTSAPTPAPTLSLTSTAPVSSDVDQFTSSVMPSHSPHSSSMPSYHIAKGTHSPSTPAIIHSALSQFPNENTSSLSTPVVTTIIIASIMAVYLFARYALKISKAHTGKYSKVFISDDENMYNDSNEKELYSGVVKSANKQVTNRNKTFMSIWTKQNNMSKVYAEPLLSQEKLQMTGEENEVDLRPLHVPPCTADVTFLDQIDKVEAATAFRI